ncbi:hypothetical protein QL285_093116 [Trifolium repens]|nr:hypothetical protein QL285_093116 [Trifolium repens]
MHPCRVRDLKFHLRILDVQLLSVCMYLDVFDSEILKLCSSGSEFPLSSTSFMSSLFVFRKYTFEAMLLHSPGACQITLIMTKSRFVTS